MPVLRAAGAQAGAEARPLGRRAAAQEAPPAPADAAAAARRGDRRASRRTRGRTRRSACCSLCVLSMLVFRADDTALDLGYLGVPIAEEVWRFFAAPFLFADQIGYAFVSLVAVGIFGTLLERRFGALPVVAVFVLSGAAGMALVALRRDAAAVHGRRGVPGLRRQRRGARPAVRLARGRPPGGAPRATSATTTCSAST